MGGNFVLGGPLTSCLGAPSSSSPFSFSLTLSSFSSFLLPPLLHFRYLRRCRLLFISSSSSSSYFSSSSTTATASNSIFSPESDSNS